MDMAKIPDSPGLTQVGDEGVVKRDGKGQRKEGGSKMGQSVSAA